MKRLTRLEEQNLLTWIDNKIKNGTDKVKITYAKPGYFYTFQYTSKLYDQKKLSFYDEQPIILLIGKNSKYTLGINFHYITPRRRKLAINKLKKKYKKEFKKNKPLSGVNWETIRSELKYAIFMVKLYINSNISFLTKINNNEVDKIIDLPSDTFIGEDINKIWKSLGL